MLVALFSGRPDDLLAVLVRPGREKRGPAQHQIEPVVKIADNARVQMANMRRGFEMFNFSTDEGFKCHILSFERL